MEGEERGKKRMGGEAKRKTKKVARLKGTLTLQTLRKPQAAVRYRM